MGCKVSGSAALGYWISGGAARDPPPPPEVTKVILCTLKHSHIRVKGATGGAGDYGSGLLCYSVVKGEGGVVVSVLLPILPCPSNHKWSGTKTNVPIKLCDLCAINFGTTDSTLWLLSSSACLGHEIYPKVRDGFAHSCVHVF